MLELNYGFQTPRFKIPPSKIFFTHFGIRIAINGANHSRNVLYRHCFFRFFFQQASRFNFRHIDMDSTQREAKAMDDLREKIEKVFADDLAFPYSRFYLGWETNKVFIKLVRTTDC